MATKKQTLKTWFENFKKPNQEQFWAWMDAYWHKDEKLPLDAIKELDKVLGGFATEEQLEGLALTNASNLTEDNIEAWKTILSIDNLPDNVAFIDAENSSGNVYSKPQVDDLLQVISDALGLVETAIANIGDKLNEIDDDLEELEKDLSKTGHALDYDTDQDKVILQDKRGEEISAVPLPLSAVGKSGKYEDLIGKPDLENYQKKLTAGDNIIIEDDVISVIEFLTPSDLKTINNESIVGKGNIEISVERGTRVYTLPYSQPIFMDYQDLVDFIYTYDSSLEGIREGDIISSFGISTPRETILSSGWLIKKFIATVLSVETTENGELLMALDISFLEYYNHYSQDVFLPNLDLSPGSPSVPYRINVFMLVEGQRVLAGTSEGYSIIDTSVR